MEQFNRRLLSKQAADVWANPEKVQQYYQASLSADASTPVQAGDRLPRLNDEQTREYQKWTPFADVWDVRATSCMHACMHACLLACLLHGVLARVVVVITPLQLSVVLCAIQLRIESCASETAWMACFS